MKKLALFLIVALVAFNVSLVSSSFAQSKVVRVSLIDENGSGEDGSAQFTDMGDGSTKVELIMLNGPEGVPQPASIHKGSCTTLDANTAFALDSVKEGKSTSTVKTALTDLTKEKYAIVVYKSDAEKIVYSCGNLPQGTTSSGSMTMDQVLSTLLDDANELLGTIKKKETDASKNAYTIYHDAFASHEEEIKAKSADTQAKLEDAMHEVDAALKAGDWAKAETAANELVDTIKQAQTAMGGSGATTSLTDALDKLKSAAADVQREAKNSDKEGLQRAYDEFHTIFAANEEAIKATNAEAQEHIESAMHEVRDAIAAGDFSKAATAANELVKEVNDAIGELSGSTSGSTSGSGTTTTTTTSTNADTNSMMNALTQLKSAAADIQREAKNSDKEGSQRAYDSFHTLFAANEDAIKAKNAEAQGHIETAMHEVRDAITAGDFSKATVAADELVNEVNDAYNEMSGSSNSSLPTSGYGDTLLVLFVVVGLAVTLLLIGANFRYRIAR